MDHDAELLQRYAETGAQGAFTEFAHRHIPLVYAAALRRMGGDGHGAADVTQLVFISAAKHAPALVRHPRLTGWLYATTRHATINAMRTELRRRHREQEANRSSALAAPGPQLIDWDHLRPLIDTAMDDLATDDREAVLMRFFENRAFREIGDRLRVTENAARMRVERAIGKLHGILQQRGISSTSAALAAVLTSQSQVAAAEVPTGLAAGIVSTALASESSAFSAVAALETFVIMNSKAIIGTAAAVILAGLIGITTYQVRQSAAAQAELSRARQAAHAQRAILANSRAMVAAAERELTVLQAEVDKARENSKVPASAAATAAPLAASAWDPAAEGRAFVERHPEVKLALDDYALASFRFQYAPIIRELALSAEQVQKLSRIWSRGAMGASLADGRSISLGYGREDMLSGEQISNEARMVIGNDGVRRWSQYGQHVTGRRIAADVASELYFTEAPLNAEQAEKLITIIAANRLPRSTAHNWDGILAQAAGVLSPPQVEVLARRSAKERFSQVLTRTVRPSSK